MNWEHPELSVGEKCEHQPIGLTCYEATGAAQQTFIGVTPAIAKLLEDNKADLEKGLRTSSSSGFHLFMVAKNKPLLPFTNPPSDEFVRRQTRPTIAIISKSKKYRKRALSLLKGHELIKELPGFELAGFDRDPAVPMAASLPLDSNHELDSNIFVAENDRMLPGSSLLFPTTGKIATLGGIVNIDGTHYGMTAYHASIKDHGIENKSDCANEELSSDNDDNDDCSDCSDDYGFEDSEDPLQDALSKSYQLRIVDRARNLVENCSFPQSYYSSAGPPTSNKKMQTDPVLSQSPPLVPRPGTAEKSKNYQKLGTVTSGCGSSDLDYLIFPIESSAYKEIAERDLLTTIDETPNVRQSLGVTKERPNKQEVWAATGTTGPVKGVILCNPHFIKMPGTSYFEEMWAVKLERKTLPGDCGAWVVDKVTNKLFGHIVAGDPHSCLAYIIPAYKIMEDISSQLGKAPTFSQINPRAPALSQRQSSDIQSAPLDTRNTKSWKYTTRLGRCQPIRPGLSGIRDEAYSRFFQELASGREAIIPLIEKASFVASHFTDQEFASRREAIISEIDEASFDTRILAIAAIGLFTDAINSLATYMGLWHRSYIYGSGQMPPGFGAIIVCASLTGSFIGQLLFGMLADLYGRQRLYGLELFIVIFSTLGLATSYERSNESAHVMSWMVLWRFTMGIGVGGDYPLSAVITSEFAPRKSRLRMLSSVFYLQPIGLLLAILITNILAGSASGWTSPDRTSLFETGEATRMIDGIWRFIIGIGAVPALIGIWLRWSIPESPRWTMDVANDFDKARRDTNFYVKDRIDQKYEDASMWRKCLGRRRGLKTNNHWWLESDRKRSALSRDIRDTLDDWDGPDSIRQGPLQASFHEASFHDAKKYFFTQGNWRYLVGASLSWFLLDFAFYGLGMNSPAICRHVWSENRASFVAIQLLLYNNTTGLYITSALALPVGAVLVKLVKYWPRRNIQLWGFYLLATLFTIIGAAIMLRFGGRTLVGLLIMYQLFLVFFNFGPNVMTFIIPAELFPTRYRATCNGIAAASGTLGCILAQLFFTKVRFDGKGWGDPDPELTWLGPVLLILCISMAASSVTTWFWIPETRDKNGESRSLEELALGYQRIEGDGG